ncbi:MAG: pyridoxal phosphate-dependent aminotransferase [Thermoguttaceae bacterium]|nr:pyridoxal phosphate-dependent aminotransferase [Thermoguttaceae bacterium]MDW8039735.1 pyridoxal phosphate-dependent aminotransferase [Thermoguttaceae bacterium]
MAMEEPLLSFYGQASSRPAPVNRMMAQFAADFRDQVDINLGVGYVNENTIPRDWIRQALEQVLANPQKHRVALNYGGPTGSPNLIDSIRRFYLEHRIGGLTEDLLRQRQIIIGPNGASSLLEAIAQVLAPGLVVTTDPIYYIYCDFLERIGFRLLAIPEDAEGMDTERLEAELDRLGPRQADIRFFYLVTVNNPTCTILSNRRRQQVVEIASRLSRQVGRKVPVVFDLAYELLIHDPIIEAPVSGLLFDELGIVYEIGTLSKILAPALRIGYLIGSDGPMLRAIVQKTSDSGFSAPLVTQEIASVLLDCHAAEQIEKVRAGYRQKAQMTRRWLEERLGPYLATYTGGQAGFYFYLTFAQIETHEDSAFFRFLTRTTGNPAIDGPPQAKKPRVMYIPGPFCVHRHGQLVEAGRRQLRLSYGFEELDRLEQAIALMAEAAAYAQA